MSFRKRLRSSKVSVLKPKVSKQESECQLQKFANTDSSIQLRLPVTTSAISNLGPSTFAMSAFDRSRFGNYHRSNQILPSNFRGVGAGTINSDSPANDAISVPSTWMPRRNKNKPLFAKIFKKEVDTQLQQPPEQRPGSQAPEPSSMDSTPISSEPMLIVEDGLQKTIIARSSLDKAETEPDSDSLMTPQTTKPEPVPDGVLRPQENLLPSNCINAAILNKNSKSSSLGKDKDEKSQFPLPRKNIIMTRRRVSEAVSPGSEDSVDFSISKTAPVSSHTYDNPPLKMFVCDSCITFNKKESNFKKHLKTCRSNGVGPPGRIVYEKDATVIYEIDGDEEQQFCFNISKLSKCYVNSTCSWRLTKEFMYYALYVSGHFAGYFSKEKQMMHKLNLGVLLVLPSHQKKGFGRLLVSFSYEISKLKKQIGTPERPLSDSGLRCYLSYWMENIINYLHTHNLENLSIEALSNATYIHIDDIVLAFTTFCEVYRVQDNCIVLFQKQIYGKFLKAFELRTVNGNSDRIPTTSADGAEDSNGIKGNSLDLNCIFWPT